MPELLEEKGERKPAEGKPDMIRKRSQAPEKKTRIEISMTRPPARPSIPQPRPQARAKAPPTPLPGPQTLGKVPKVPVLKTRVAKTGLQNGRKDRGFSNGFKGVLRHPARIATQKRLKIRFIATIVIIFVIISVTLMIFEIERADKIKIDGSFGDWNDARKFDFVNSGKGMADIVSGASMRSSSSLYLYVKLADLLTVGRKVLVSAFVDTDADPSTGYSVLGIGADMRIDAQSDLSGGTVSEFQGSDQELFSWMTVSSTESAFSGSEAEFKAITSSVHDDYRVVFTTVDDLSHRDISDYPIAPSPVIVLEKRTLASTLPFVESDAIEIAMAAHGGDGVLSTIEVDSTPTSLKVIKPVLPVTLGLSPVSLKVRADASQVQSGTFVSIKIKSATGSVPTYVYGDDLKGYAIAPPSDIKIDGAFDDWKKVSLNKQSIDPKVRDGLDITSTAKSNESAGLALLLGVRDNIFLGTFSPLLVSVQGSGGGGTPTPPTKGEDVAYIFMDFDNGALQLRAEIHGKHGIVSTSGSSLFKLVNNLWEKIASIDAGSNRSMLETMIPSTYFENRKNVKIYYQIFGWNDLGEGLLAIGDSDDEPIPTPDAVPKFMYRPIASDISPGSFRLSWVSDQSVNATVEYCQYSAGVCDAGNFPGSPSTSYDTAEFLANGTSLVDVAGLSSGTQYFYRAKARNPGSEVAYSPSSPPYPNVTTKINPSSDFNPPFIVRPYHDVNHDGVYGSPPDVKQNYFLVYLNHTGADPLVSRGDSWEVVITASRLTNNDSAGGSHTLIVGDTVSYFVTGLYNDSSGISYWVNRTATTTVPWTDQPILVNISTEKVVPELRAEALLPSGAVLVIATVAVLYRVGRRE
jgi:hypothetical protein